MTGAELAPGGLFGGAGFPNDMPGEFSGAAGQPREPHLRDAYRTCRHVAAEHGRTYFLATRLLSAPRRPAVHALYAFARMVDDIVDCSEPTTAQIGSRPQLRARGDGRAPEPAAELDLIERQLRTTLERGVDAVPASARDQILLALADTIRRYGIAPRHFWTFLDSMRMDIPGTPNFRDRYATMAELREYMRGSAAAIGLQLLPILGTVVPVPEAEPAAAALGEAFQLTNFLRDIGEDLDRGRVYLPADELAVFGVDHDLLAHCHRRGAIDPRVRRALAHLIALNRDIYRRANPGIELLEPRVRPAIRTASTLYAAILDRIESNDYEVFRARAIVARHRRLAVAATEFTAAALHRAR